MVIQSIIPSVNMVQQWLVNLLAFLLHAAPSWEANLFSASQEIPRILLSPKVHYRIYKCPILSQINPVHAPHPTSWRFILILSSHLRLGLPSGLFPSGFTTKTPYTPLPSPTHAAWLITVVTKVPHWNLSLSTSTSRIRFSCRHFSIITHLVTIRKWHLFKFLNTSFSPVRLKCPTSLNLTGLIVPTIHEWWLAGQPAFACWQSSKLPPFPTEYWAHAPFYAVSKTTYREILPWGYGTHTHFAQYLIRHHGVDFRHRWDFIFTRNYRL